MDAEGGRVVHRERRARKLAVVVALQNVMVIGCLLITLYVYWGVQTEPSEDIVHIKFDVISGNTGNVTLNFNSTQSKERMGMSGNKIDVKCTGPYILYMDVCYSNTGEVDTGILQLQVEGSTTPATSFPLQTSGEDCRGLHSIVFLRAGDKASVHWYASAYIKIKSASLGLSYLLGSQCYF
ncbi:hypothetical protein EXN66_Car006810 [Channa argus]|uniref:TNF family profile domain-containing protein n=1 Tax=Channa argus TaxID=215402 RepID=A0A6G1PMA1_CHAAH|nr:hypothetical protein EXN66_Car006810 [Channa argus]